MKWTVLGCNGPFPGAESGTSGYLLEANGMRVLFDCGSGCMQRFRSLCGQLAMPDAIVLSHLHYDHISDLFLLKYAYDLENARAVAAHEPIPLYLPGAPAFLREELCAGNAFQPVLLADGCTFEIGGLTVRACAARHPVEAYSFRIAYGDASIVYLGDTQLHDALTGLCADADVLIAHAGRLDAEVGPHTSAREAGALAREAEVQTLLLSHVFPHTDVNALREEAEQSIDIVLKEHAVQHRCAVHVAHAGFSLDL